MDFHLATPTGDIYLFSYDGRQVQVLANDAASKPAAAVVKSDPAVTDLAAAAHSP